MNRCKEPAGRYRLSLRIAHHPEPYRVQVMGHGARETVVEVDGNAVLVEPSPFVGTTEPYEGELCAHELQWLNGVPGKDWRPEYEFTLERLDEPPAAGG